MACHERPAPPHDLLLESAHSMNVQPLTGIRVIDLTRVLSVPFSTMLLAEMGPDVVRIETPQGDTVGAPITDLVAGLYCAFGVVSAIRARELTGRGQRVEAAMVNGMVSMLAYLASEYLSTGRTPHRNGNDHPIASPYGLFRATDGDIA